LHDVDDEVGALDEVDEVDEERLCVDGVLGRGREVRGMERLNSSMKAVMTRACGEWVILLDVLVSMSVEDIFEQKSSCRERP